jgi:hypothetical protein
MADPRSHVGALVLAGAMTFEPAPLELFEVRVPAIRRQLPSSPPPLDLTVIPFRYRVRNDRIVALRVHCGHGERHRR